MSASPDAMRAIVVTLDPGVTATRVDSAAAVIRSLGHEVTLVGYDLSEIRERTPPADVLVVEAGAHLEIARDAVKRLRRIEALAPARVLLCIDVGRVAGLDPEIGADDFILMPVVPRELSARLRQLAWREAVGQGGRVIRSGGFVLDCVALQATYRSRPLKLTPYEFQLLKFLMERAGVVFSREELLTRVWGYRHIGRVRTVDTHILNLRGKLGEVGDLLEAVRGMGYKLRRIEGAEPLIEQRSIA
jgi:two-component system, OmpR family, alkaline phosphatase synthesis response regulator PhoP